MGFQWGIWGWQELEVLLEMIGECLNGCISWHNLCIQLQLQVVEVERDVRIVDVYMLSKATSSNNVLSSNMAN